MRPKSITRWQWAKISMLFGLLYTLAAYLISTPYLSFIHAPSWLGKSYLTLAYIGQIGLLGLLGTLLSTLITPIIKQRHLNYTILWLIGSATLVLLYTDTRVYELYRFHLGGFVWSLVFGEGASQVIKVSWYTIAVSVFMVALFAAYAAFSIWLSVRLTLNNRFKGSRWLYSLAVVVSFLSANVLHVWYDAHGNAEIRGMTRHLPLYQPATAVEFMSKQGWIDPHTVSKRPSLHNVAGSELNYPTEGFEVHSNNKPNILFVTADAWRGDTFDAQTTPFTYSLINQPDAQYFTDHQSGGNVTKGGIFSLFYALPPTYWDAFTAAQRPPVFFSTLLDAGYQTGIFGSGPLINPSFHRNAFSNIPNLKTKTEGDTPYQRDEKMVSNLTKFLHKETDPFVSFVFFDAAHGYAPPPDFEPKFQPYWDRVDHVELGPDFDPLPYKNRYRTALRFIDEQIKTIYETLEETGKLDNTIVIFTSDHGEEFNETKMNYWGHGSNFTQNQTHVPLLILWPGKAAQQFDYRTSHYDIVPTLLQEALGVDVPMREYSSGRSLFDSTPREWLLVHSYFNYGVLMEDRIITTFPTGQFEITDLDLQPTDKEMPAKVTLEVLQEIGRFYQ
ncbi:hydrolase [Marinomonas piezotolerans]|uniref:Hydrolase n=1 Tax=Marinomonas piezotolerans TaxID=2213058 RepID=A0A370U8H2_9GAMM|nr:DUF3413 domain-containing protein [Marinomonas piezotolerans]RDL44100.1 hydrolase [Marinomonas piezotolerans]